MAEPSTCSNAPRRGGCGAILGIGCAGVLVLALIVGLIAWFNRDVIARHAFVTVALMGGEELIAQVGLEVNDQEAVMRSMRKLGEQIKAGEVSMEQGEAIAAEMQRSATAAVVLLRAFETRYLESDAVPEAEREAAKLACNRYARAVQDGRIPRHTLGPLVDLVSTETTNEDGETVREWDTDLTPQQVEECRTYIANTVASYQITDEYTAIDLEAMLDDAIERGLEGKQIDPEVQPTELPPPSPRSDSEVPPPSKRPGMGIPDDQQPPVAPPPGEQDNETML